MDISELIDQGESQSLEFKESLKLKDEIGETVSAFSNSDGGAVVVGKTNQRVSASEIRRLAREEKRRLSWDERICEDAGLDDICARFKGIKPLEFIDMKVFGGNMIDQREDAVEFVKEHIKLHAKIVGLERIETWEYPIAAIREAITNAICHRDYEISANVQVRIFDDRIEIWGCGHLPEPLTVEDLKQRHRSILRNPLVGKCFFLIKFIEQWGTGTNRIIDACLNHGLPEPVFEELSGCLVVTLRKGITEDLLREKGLNERQIKAVSYITEKGSIANKEYQVLFDVSRVTATRDLKLLEGEGILKRTGKGKRDLKYMLK